MTTPTRKNEHAYFYIPDPKDSIISNSAHCSRCDDEVVSVDPMVYTSCKCKNIKIKGGMKSILHQWVNAEFYKRKCIVIIGDTESEQNKRISKLVKKL